MLKNLKSVHRAGLARLSQTPAAGTLLVDALHDGLVELWTVRSAARATGLSKSASCRI